jgi:iron complex outermembrane recepter protein
VRASDRDQTTRWSTYNWSVLSESWAGGKKYFNGVYDSDPWDGQPGTETYAAPNYDTVSFDDFYRGQAAGVSGGRILAPSADLVSDYDRFKTELSSIFGFNHLQTRDDLVRDSYLPVEINGVNERRSAAYLMLNFGSPEDTWVGNAGLRYVTITNKTDGGVAFADFGDSTLLLPADDIAFMNGATYAADARNSSSEWLPSLNLKYNINDDWLMRFGYSKAVAFPDMGNLRNYMGIYAVVQEHDTDNDGQADTGTVSEYRAGTGNPYLEPMRADNFDITLEWYFDDVGAVSAGLFYKEMSNYFSAGAYPQNITNNGITQTVEVDGPVNAGAATIKGVELAYQQFFEDLPGAWSGLGVQANYTYLANNGAPNQNLRPDDGSVVEVVFDDLPLQGMSEHTYNLVGMYEYQGLSARLAWNWRSEYLLTTRDVITKLPIYNAPEGQLDGSIFYTINDHIKIGVQATNLLNKTTRTKMQVAQDGTKVDRSWFINDRRFDAVVRLTF